MIQVKPQDNWIHSALYATISFFLIAAVGYFTTPYMAIATLAYLIMTAGLFLRKQKQIHMKLMSAAIAIDILLVLILQIQRGAIQTAMSFEMNFLQQSHIGTSSIALLLYFPLMYLGYKQSRSTKFLVRWKKLHIVLGIAAYTFRTLGFLLMFTLVEYYRTKSGLS